MLLHDSIVKRLTWYAVRLLCSSTRPKKITSPRLLNLLTCAAVKARHLAWTYRKMCNVQKVQRAYLDRAMLRILHIYAVSTQRCVLVKTHASINASNYLLRHIVRSMNMKYSVASMGNFSRFHTRFQKYPGVSLCNSYRYDIRLRNPSEFDAPRKVFRRETYCCSTNKCEYSLLFEILRVYQVLWILLSFSECVGVQYIIMGYQGTAELAVYYPVCCTEGCCCLLLLLLLFSH